MGDRVRITDVSPRDGLQNEPGVIGTADKLRLVELLRASGVDEVEVTSFVSPKWIPQLADAADLLRALNRPGRRTPPEHSVLVPNAKGMEAALAADVFGAIDKVAVFTAASETFAKRNTNASIAETLERFAPVIKLAHTHGLKVRGYVSCVIACPFEGVISPDAVARVSSLLLELGVDEIDLGDTIGAGTAESMAELLRVCGRSFSLRGSVPVTIHLHDTVGLAAGCVRAALDAGVRSFDGSVAGLGGCPYASTPERRAPGNISTELLVHTAESAGFTTGVDRAKLESAAEHARRMTGGMPSPPTYRTD